MVVCMNFSIGALLSLKCQALSLQLQQNPWLNNGWRDKLRSYGGARSYSLIGNADAASKVKVGSYKFQFCERVNVLPHVQTLRGYPKEQLQGKVVLMDKDEDTRPKNSSFLTIKYLNDVGAIVIVISNWRMKGLHPLEDVAEYLSSELQLQVLPVKGFSTHGLTRLQPYERGKLILLDNLSGTKEELANDVEFAKRLSAGIDIFVNDSFSLAHKALASTVGITRYCCASLAGFYFVEGINQLRNIVESTKHPYFAIIGGGNLVKKSAALQFLAATCDGIIFVGAMAFQIMHALGMEVPLSCLEPRAYKDAKYLINYAAIKGIPIILPKDFWCINNLFPQRMEVFQCHRIDHGWSPIDLGPDSIAEIASLLTRCEQVLWIGPVNFGLSDQTNGGAAKLASILKKLSQGDCKITIVGNVACENVSGPSKSLSEYDMIESASIVWELLKRKDLPGLLSLDRAYPFEIDWSTIYPEPNQPLIVDLGSGNGMFIKGIASKRKDINCLGIEMNEKLVPCCLVSAEQSKLKNVYFIAANATYTFRSIVSSYPGPLVMVSIQCPNPDFNEPYHRWRMVQPSLIKAIADLLVSGGKVFLQSDIEAVAMRMREQFLKESNGRLVILQDDTLLGEWLIENPFQVQSDWERHVLARGAPMYRLMLYKPCSCIATCDAGTMQTEKQVLLEFQENLPPGNSICNEESPILPSSSNHGASKKPDKRPTRQWAAWTREEEECFFTALRQNFEKITSRVQSKNKDQVRHYYYRLVRRMNKLLGPGFCLDAKNSKDTNAAMLRWWSLLEKYSCKASKLHLKPRRFKIFIEALEHQLLKDRKKNVRRRLPQGENCPSLFPTPSLQQNKPSTNETHSVKFVLVDSQNIHKAGIGKGYTLRRNPNNGINKSSNKGDSSPTKASKQRRRTGGALSAAAVKRWEKAAIAGVSLVADAAEHLERAACSEEPQMCGVFTHSSLQEEARIREERRLGPSNVLLPPFPNISSNVPQSCTQTTGKIKLQLFPMDDGTKRSLEMDKHNPYLELTLSTRKKITSVMEHLNKKWGNCTVASGELMLFPYSTERENILKCERWTRVSFATAADVYAVLGNPPVFRLRYGWVSPTELQSATSATPSGISIVDPIPTSGPESWSNAMGYATPGKDKGASSSHGNAVLQPMNDSPDEATGYDDSDPENDLLDLCGFGGNALFRRNLACYGVEKMGVGNSSSISAGEWADSLTNVSVGDLLTEVSDVDADCVDAPCNGSPPSLEEIPFTCDSFDAAIAAHILSHHNKLGFQSAVTSHSSSIWDAEETCDAFSFQNRSLDREHTQPSSLPNSPPVHGDLIRTSSAGSDSFLKGLHEEEEMVDLVAQGDLVDEEGPSEPNIREPSSSKDLNSLTDMYWPESLGPLDLDAPSCRYYGQDIILSDSLGGLSRLIASSLDAFQNCSFFSSEKKETSSATEVQGKASSPDNTTVAAMKTDLN
ncbi:hypothetical protein V2J09_005099 [Rumex salicifolius]